MTNSNLIRLVYPDDDVQQRVSSFLHSRHFTSLRRLNVAVRHGSVTLTGEVFSYYEKQVALNSCQRVAGVLHLIDEVAVVPEPPVLPR
jgi:osmotically-inducible protein OsmY